VPEISKSIKIDGIHNSVRTVSRFCGFKFGDRRAITLGGPCYIHLTTGANNYLLKQMSIEFYPKPTKMSIEKHSFLNKLLYILLLFDIITKK